VICSSTRQVGIRMFILDPFEFLENSTLFSRVGLLRTVCCALSSCPQVRGYDVLPQVSSGEASQSTSNKAKGIRDSLQLVSTVIISSFIVIKG
jgi:hypothetical protein